MENSQLELIVGENLAKLLTQDNCNYLINKIKKLREEKNSLPLIHITDEIKIDKNSYEIRNFGKTILKETIPTNQEYCILSEKIIMNLNIIYNY